MPRRRKGRRRGRLIAVSVLLLIAVVVGVIYLLDVARTLTDPLGQALAARGAGDTQRAEELLRRILHANPQDVRARQALIDMLVDVERLEEAQDLARVWLDAPETEVRGLKSSSLLAFMRGEASAAMRYARMVADRDPAFSQRMLMQVEDAVGSPGSRGVAPTTRGAPAWRTGRGTPPGSP